MVHVKKEILKKKQRKTLLFVGYSGYFSCVQLFASPPGSSVHGILQATLLEWVAMLSKVSHSPDSLSRCSPRPFCQLLISQALSLSSYSLSAFHIGLLSLPQMQQTFLPQDLCTYRLGWSPPRSSHGGFLLMIQVSESLSLRTPPTQPPDQSPYLRPPLPTGQ